MVAKSPKEIWLRLTTKKWFGFLLSSLPLPKRQQKKKTQKPKENKKEGNKERESTMALPVSYSTLACFSSLPTSSLSSSPYSILPITTNPGEIISIRCSSLLFSFLFFTSPSRNTKRPIDSLSLYLHNNPKQTELTFWHFTALGLLEFLQNSLSYPCVLFCKLGN